MTARVLQRTSTSQAEDFAIPIPAGFQLASGDVLEDRHIALRRFGRRDAPQVVALGGISAGRDVCGETGWWRGTLISHAGVDLDHYGLIGFDFAPACDQRVRITPHDQARLIDTALDSLGVANLHAFLGASYGGMVGLAFAALAPRRSGRLCVISAAHSPSAQSLAWRGVQRRIVEFGLEHGDGGGGLSLARQLAMITYRTGAEFDARFGAGIDAQGRGEVDRYLEARGATYGQTVSPRRWLSLSEAIDRTFVNAAAVETPTTLVSCPDDQLVPIATMRELADRLPRLREFHVLPSLYGHDAFLKEPERLGLFISKFLQEAAYG